MHAIYRTWQCLFPWALLCFLLRITKVLLIKKVPTVHSFHKYKNTLYSIWCIWSSKYTFHRFLMAYTTLFVRLFSYVTAVLLAIRKEGGPVRPLLLFVLRNLKKNQFFANQVEIVFFWGRGVNFLMIKKSQNKQQCRSINTISNLVHLHM